MTGRRLTTPPVATTTRSTSARVASVSRAPAPPTRSTPDGRSSRREGALVGQRNRPRPKERRLFRQPLAIGAGGEDDDLEHVGMRREHVDRLPADRAGGSEQGNPTAGGAVPAALRR